MKRLLPFAFLVGCGTAQPPSECPVGVTCGPPPSTLQLAAELTPPATSSEVAQEVALLGFDQAGVATVALVPRLRVTGTVAGAKGLGIPAQVIISRPSLIVGNPDVSVQTTTDSAGNFTLTVPRSQSIYRLTVLPRPPADALYPPTSLPLVAQPDKFTDDLKQVTVCLAGGTTNCPSLREMASVAGQVTDAFGNGLGDARVSAIDPVSGEVRSSVATTGSDGAFTVYLSPDVAADALVRVVAAPDAKLGLPTLWRDVKASDASAVELRMPATPAAQTYQLPVGGTAPSGAQVELAGARVDFTADFGDGYAGTHARYATSAITDATGLATAQLIPGTSQTNRGYTVVVTPPADSVFARGTFDAIPVGARGTGVLGGVTLDLRARLAGFLLGNDGAPVKGATVSAQPSAAAVNSAFAAQGDLAVPSTLTGADGSFALHVDRGWYDVQFVPPTGAPLPSWSEDNRDVEMDVDLAQVRLPQAVMAEVRVLAPDGMTPVAGLDVRVLARAFDVTCPQAGACPLPARVRGEGVTDGNGAAPLLLPSP